MKSQSQTPVSHVKVLDTELVADDTRERYREKIARITLDSMVQFVGLLDAKGAVLEINQVALDAVGIKLADVEGRPFWTTFWWQVSEEINATLREMIARAAQGEFVRWDTPIYERAGGKETIIIDASLMPVRDEQGKVVFIAAEGRDITEKKAYEREIARQREELAELDKLKTQFFANISHEFRTPLTLMMGPLEDALTDGEELSAANRERLELAYRNASRQLKLVNMLLDFSRIEAGRTQASYEPTDLSAFTTDLASVFRSAIEKAGMKLVVECPALAEPVWVDREMWEKIVLNLLSNAFKFTFDGEIKVALRQAGEAIELSVSDTGTGIPAEELSHLFERFYRVKDARGRSFEGSGIGLALVRELVKLHGGEVHVESEIDQGSTFILTIPRGTAHLPQERIGAGRMLASTGLPGRAYVEEVLGWLPSNADWESGIAELVEPAIFQTESSDQSNTQSQTASSKPQSRILLADDNADMREYLRRLLTQSGYKVEAVADGLTALQAARERRPDLVLTDVMMPGLDGFGLLAALRSVEQTRTLPVILLSARAGEEARVEGMEAGANDYIVKPFSVRELLSRVQSYLSLQRVRREAEEALRVSEDRYRTVLGSMDEGLMIAEVLFDATDERAIDYRILETNEAFYKHTGLPPGLVGRMISEVLPGVDLPQLEVYGEVAITGQPRRFEYEVKIAPVTGWYDIFVQRIGKPHQRRLALIFQNITGRKRAEANLAFLDDLSEQLLVLSTSAEIIRAVGERFGNLLGASVCAFIEINETNDEAVITDEWRRTSGQSLVGRYALPEYVTEEFRSLMSAGKPVVVCDVAQDSRIEDKAKFAALAIGSFVNVPLIRGGAWRFALGVYREQPYEWRADELDLLFEATNRIWNKLERARAEDERERLLALEKAARGQAEAANRLKDEFLATVSHELRTPLTAMLGWAHLLRANHHDEAVRTRALETIERNARAQQQLIEDLLDVSRIITGKIRLDVRPCDPATFIEAALEAVRPAADAKKVRLQKVFDAGLSSISGDPARLQQVVWNLLANAIKFTSRGGRVQVRLERVNSHVEIIVTDTGEGIDPDFLPHVFDRFRQADGSTTRAHGGLGLGLAIVRHLVELHGGTVHADSHGAGQGATFTVKLPLIPVYSREPEDERVHPRANDQLLQSVECPERLDGLKVLVVDDERDACDLLRVMLMQCGAETATALSAKEALDAMQQTRFDLLVSDIGMPGADGYELIRRVRLLPARNGGRIPAVALTAYARAEDRLRALRAGYQMHVAKPVEPSELIAIIASLATRGETGKTNGE